MNKPSLDIVVLGLSITSSWGNGHATTYRGLIRELSKRGHNVVFLERDVPWYASHRDLAAPPFCKTILYNNMEELRLQYAQTIKHADLVVVGSYVPDGVAVGEFVTANAAGITAFYDIDTPVTLAKLAQKDFEYLHPDLIADYNLYLSFTGGPTLQQLEDEYNSPMARPFYCSFDPELYYPSDEKIRWDLGYLGTYSADRQPPLQRLMLDAVNILPDLKFVVAGPQYPPGIKWPFNVKRIEHLPPSEHRIFYNNQRFAMNITRADMINAGYSPSVRLFEAAACGTPIISDYWEGLDSIFEIGTEILITTCAEETRQYLCGISEEKRISIGERARKKVMEHHTAAHRAVELEQYYEEAVQRKFNNSMHVKQQKKTA
jgi:spore maturation protein CgeB